MASYTVNKFQQAAWLVYINGLEIPAMGFTVNYGIWAMPTLSLDLVPHHSMYRIGYEDRLQVAVFYLDSSWYSKSPTFCLLGEFEVVGCSYVNTAFGRTLRLNAVSQLQILQQLNFYYVSSLDDIVTGSSKSKSQNAGTAIVPKPLYPASLFLEGLTEPPTVVAEGTSAGAEVDTDNFIKRPIDFVTNIFRALLRPVSTNEEDVFTVASGSGTLPRSASSIPGKNFFSRWLNMTDFHKRWAAMPLLEDSGDSGCFPIVKAAQDTNVLPALQNQIGGSVGNSGTAWELLQKVLSYLFMEIVTIPAPPAALTNKNTGVIEAPPYTTNVVEHYFGSDKVRSIPTFFVKPQCFFAIPPACNVIFPSMIKDINYKEDYLPQPTRIYLGESFISNVLNPGRNATIAPLINENLTTGFPTPVKKRMLDLAGSPESNNKNFLLYPEEYFKGPVTTRLNAPPWMYMLDQRSKASSSNSQDEATAIGTDEVRTALGSLFDKYAEYEYWRTRYSERSGSVSVAWNPYIVPGFPVAVFDERPSAIDIMAYPMTVTHSVTAGDAPSMSTVVSLAFIRSMPEFIGQIGSEVEEFTSTETYDISPLEPIEEIREVFQKTTEADLLYRRMLYRATEFNHPSAFDWRDLFNVVNSEGEVVDTVGEAWKLDESISLVPKDGNQSLFDSHTAAMQYASRPVCTLQEYIEIWHGKSIKELKEEGTLKGEYRSFYSPTSDKDESQGAVFWGRIYKLTQGPGDPPPVEVSNMGEPPEYSPAGDGQTVFVGKSTGMPDTRKDWDTILEKYRRIVRSDLAKMSPQQ